MNCCAGQRALHALILQRAMPPLWPCDTAQGAGIPFLNAALRCIRWAAGRARLLAPAGPIHSDPFSPDNTSLTVRIGVAPFAALLTRNFRDSASDLSAASRTAGSATGVSVAITGCLGLSDSITRRWVMRMPAVGENCPCRMRSTSARNQRTGEVLIVPFVCMAPANSSSNSCAAWCSTPSRSLINATCSECVNLSGKSNDFAFLGAGCGGGSVMCSSGGSRGDTALAPPG